MTFQFKERQLRKLCRINSFPIQDKKLVFFGLRGCLPADEDNHDLKGEQIFLLADIDYIHPRCTLGQWFPEEGKIALFPGSTVPHIRYVKMSKERNGLGANQLMTGYYEDYRRGKHRAGTSTGHDAFRQTESCPIRRTADDFDFDTDDRVEFENPYDNIHAGWSMGINHDYYASAGCQVVVGYPECDKRENKPDTGPWKIFKDNAYNLEQKSYPYVLLSGRDAQKVTLSGNRKMSARLRFGSDGDLVSELQTALQKYGYYEGIIDGDFGKRTTRAVLKYQSVTFGPSADDGIVGPITASALELSWPKL